MIKQCIATITAIACLCGARFVYPAADDNFYKGKTIRLDCRFFSGRRLRRLFTHDRPSSR
jgi:hypothetical protein